MEDNNTITNMIMNAISLSEQPKKFLQTCYVIYQATNHQAWAKEVQEFLNDTQNKRTLGYIESIKEDNETRMNYYGIDKGMKDPLLYQEETEQTLHDNTMQQLNRLSKILKEEAEKQMIRV
jgi:hypothetical protein